MKSVNAVTKQSDRMFSRLGILSFMGIMVLALAVGSPSIAAEEFQLWHKVRVSEEAQPLKHLDKAGTEKSVKWLNTEPDFKKFVSTFAKEPFQFAEGLKAGMLEAIKANKVDDFKKAVKEGLNKLESVDFGGFIRRNALLDIMEKILSMDKSKLENEKFLEELFSDPLLRNALGLTDKKDESVVDEPTPTPEVEEETNKNDGNKNTDTSKTSERETELEKALADRQAQLAQMQAALAQLQQQRLGTGEVNDAALERTAQQICDRVNALQNGVANNNNLLQQQLNGVNELFNRFAAASRVAGNQNNRNQDRLEDILPGLLQNALQPQQAQPVAPPPTAPTIPPQFAQNEPRNDNNGIFDQGIPQRPEPQPEQPQAPLMFPQQARSGVQAPISLNLPTNAGRVELREGEDQLTRLEARTPVMATLGANPGLQEVVMAKARVQGEVRQTQAALTNAKERAARLDEQLEELKEGARAALPAWVKQKEAELQSNAEKAKRTIEQFQQNAQLAAPEARDALMAQFQQLQGQQNQAEDELNRFKAQVEAEVQKGNGQIKALAKRRDQLQAVASKLEGQVGSLKEEETAMQQLINNQMQMQLAAIQGAGQPTGATQNVNRIQQGVARPGGTRSAVPSRIGLGTPSNLQSTGSVPGSSAGGVRGPLGGK